MCSFSKDSHSHSDFGLCSKADVAPIFRGIGCILTSDQREVQALLQICGLVFMDSKFAD